MLAVFGRPGSWDWLLGLHIVSALLVFTGALVIAATSFAALRTQVAERVALLRRVAFLTTVGTIVPYIALHIFGGMLADREFPKGTDQPGWLGTGWVLMSAYGVISIVVLGIIQWWALRRARAGQAGGWQGATASWLSPVAVALLLVVLFAMSAKPGQ